MEPSRCRSGIQVAQYFALTATFSFELIHSQEIVLRRSNAELEYGLPGLNLVRYDPTVVDRGDEE